MNETLSPSSSERRSFDIFSRINVNPFTLCPFSVFVCGFRVSLFSPPIPRTSFVIDNFFFLLNLPYVEEDVFTNFFFD